MELSIAFQTDKPIAAYGPLAAQAEAHGFDAVTVYNDMLYQPAWLPLLEMARATRYVRLGVAAVNPFTCHPINIAGNIALIDEAAGGRAYLGLARGAWLDFVGVQPRQPVAALAEALRCVRHLLRRDPAPLAGDFFPLAGGDALRWPILRSAPPGETISGCALFVMRSSASASIMCVWVSALSFGFSSRLLLLTFATFSTPVPLMTSVRTNPVIVMMATPPTLRSPSWQAMPLLQTPCVLVTARAIIS